MYPDLLKYIASLGAPNPVINIPKYDPKKYFKLG